MKLKTAILGVAVASLAALPVLALGSHHSVGVRNYQGTGVYYDDTSGYQSQGASMNWVSVNGAPQLNFGATGVGDDLYQGLRLDCAGMPATSWQADWKRTNTSADYQWVYMFWNLPTTGATDDTYEYLSSLPVTGFTATPLSNGFTRYACNAAAFGIAAGSTWNVIEFVDDEDGISSQNSITNVFVNGIPMTANVNNGTNPPAFDYTLDW